MDDPENITISTSNKLHIRRTMYSSTLLLSFIASLGLCCAVFIILPSNHPQSSGDDNRSKDIAYASIRFTISFILLFFCTYGIWIVRNRVKFHNNQEVYWPFECSHCAKAVGLVSNPSGRGFDQSSQRQSKSSDCLKNEEGLSSNPTVNDSCDTNEECEQQQIKSLAPSYIDNNIKEMEIPNQRWAHEPIHKKPHKSLLRVCNLFGILVVMNLPVQLMAVMMCLALTDGSVFGMVALLSKFLFEVSVSVAIVTSLFFFNTYYEAVFIDVAKFSYTFGVFFATCLWMMNLNISAPIGRILDAYYDPLEHHCEIRDKFKHFILEHDERITPFYAECSIVFAAIIWQMWSAILPHSFVDARSSMLMSNCLNVIRNESFCRKIKNYFRKFLERNTPSRERTTEERAPLSGSQRKSREIKSFRNTCSAILIIFSLLYITGHFILFRDSLPFSASTLTYLRWSLEIAYSLPLVGLLRYHSFIMNRFKMIPVKPGISSLHGLLEGHDRLLLLSCGGVFVISIFRLIGAIEMFCHLSSVGREDIVLASYAAIYSIFRIYLFWSMTSFLFVVQHRLVQLLLETKLVLVCLIYTIVLNATNWLYSVAEENTWIELQSYYGSNLGEVMGGLFEPFESLYGLHAAIVAYESYQDLLSDDKSLDSYLID